MRVCARGVEVSYDDDKAGGVPRSCHTQLVLYRARPYMLLSRSLSTLLLPRLALSILTTSRLPTATSLLCDTSASACVSPGLYHPFSPRSISVRSMGSDASKASDASFPKGKSDKEWRTVLSPEQVGYPPLRAQAARLTVHPCAPASSSRSCVKTAQNRHSPVNMRPTTRRACTTVQRAIRLCTSLAPSSRCVGRLLGGGERETRQACGASVDGSLPLVYHCRVGVDGPPSSTQFPAQSLARRTIRLVW